MNVSHEALEGALVALGYEVSQYETHRLYENPAYGSILMLPHILMEQRVRPAHLSALRHAVVRFGVADEGHGRAADPADAIGTDPAPLTAFRASGASRPTKPRQATARPPVEV